MGLCSIITFCSFNGHYEIIVFLSVIISLLSITVFIFSFIFCIVQAIYEFSIVPLLCVMPSTLVIFYKLIFSGNFKNLISVLLGIGLFRFNKNKTYFKHSTNFKNIFSFTNLYFFLSWTIFFIINSFFDVQSSLIFLSIIILFLINETISRFADIQTFHIAIFTAATSSAIVNQILYC